MNFLKAVLCVFVLSVLSAAPAFAVKQVGGGAFSMSVHNGTSNSSSFKWIINDAKTSLNVSISLECEPGVLECDFVKYVSVEPKSMFLRSYSYGYVNVTASIPSDYNLSNSELKGVLVAKAPPSGGQVAIVVGASKNFVINVIRYDPEPTNASQQASSSQGEVSGVLGGISGLASSVTGFIPSQVGGSDNSGFIIMGIGVLALLLLVGVFAFMALKKRGQ